MSDPQVSTEDLLSYTGSFGSRAEFLYGNLGFTSMEGGNVPDLASFPGPITQSNAYGTTQQPHGGKSGPTSDSPTPTIGGYSSSLLPYSSTTSSVYQASTPFSMSISGPTTPELPTEPGISSNPGPPPLAYKPVIPQPSTKHYCNVNGCRNRSGFTSLKSRLVHARRVHPHLLFCSCPECPWMYTYSSFPTREDLDQHWKLVHPSTKHFRCSECSYTTDNVTNMNFKHLGVHFTAEGDISRAMKRVRAEKDTRQGR